MAGADGHRILHRLRNPSFGNLPPGLRTAFFAFHFGGFTAGHGVFILVLLVLGVIGEATGGELGIEGVTFTAGGLGLLLMVVAAAARATRRIPARRAIPEAYLRVVPLHGLILGVFYLSGEFDGGRWLALLIVGVFLLADAAGALWTRFERARA